MAQNEEAEVRAACAEGILGNEDAQALLREAKVKGRSPLEVLLERGAISERTLFSLRGVAKRGGVETADGETLPVTPSRSPSHPDPDATITVDPDAPSSLPSGPSHPAFPIAGWDRYQPIRFLGQGGMGKVFLARDLRLQREVAIKFVRSDDGRHTARLLTEARAQARVEHERVCKVYEVGEAEGQVYIAMQYIAGETLDAAARTLKLEERVVILRDCALGLHEAHKAGIVHRDIKPGNIMVERGDDGRLKPYVMDFGLAREWGEGSGTETGTILGTPHYMSPEQARGEVQRLDRRADVYSLGATLYFLLTGRPAMAGDNALAILNQIATTEPAAPRSVDRDIPVDLEAITLKCLEKERSARYNSAKALAEDLDRFLAGDPVNARPTGAWYRLRKRLAKNKRLVVASVVGFSLLVTALGWGISARREAAERERFSQRFTELVGRMESRARYSALSPLHDIRGDQAKMRETMTELEVEIGNAGPLARGAGHYALGRGYLALGDEAKARELLEAAWAAGYREPRAAYALALVMGHLYQSNLVGAERIRSAEQREAKKREIEKEYRDPALSYLKQSEGAEVPSKEYVAALVAFYEGRYEEALQKLNAVGDGLPWFYEAAALRGDVFGARAADLRNKGEREGATADFEAGRKAYAEAAARGESVPGIYEALGELEYLAMRLALYGEGEVDPPFERGLAAVTRALTAQPDDYASLLLEARLHRSKAEYKSNRGENVENLIGKAIAAVQKAIAVAPRKAEARLELGFIYLQWGQARQGRSEDPAEQLRKALEASEAIAEAERDYLFHLHVGLVFQVWADYEEQTGADPSVHRGKSIEAYLAASRLNARLSEVWINLGIAYFTRAADSRSKTPDEDLGQAKVAIDKALAIDPNHIVSWHYAGQIESLAATHKRDRGEDSRPELDRALLMYKKGIEINPRVPHLHNGAGDVLVDQAVETWERGGDPEPAFGLAIKAFERAVEVAPQQTFGYNNVGYAFVRRATYQVVRGEDPEVSVKAAEIALKKAIERAHDAPQAWVNLGTGYVALATFEFEKNQDPQKNVERAITALTEALTRNENDGDAHQRLGQALSLFAQYLSRKHKATEADFEKAAKSFEKALALDPEILETAVAFGHFCREWARWKKSVNSDPMPTLEQGFTLAASALKARPNWAEALVLRGSLLLAKAENTADPNERRTVARSALTDLNSAFAVNANLRAAWRDRATLAENVAASP